MRAEVLARGVRAWRTLAGKDTAVERFLRHQYGRATSRRERKYSGKDYTIFWSGSGRQRTGIFMHGGCDLPSLFTAVPAMQRVLDGRCCLLRHGSISDSVSPLLLQALETDWPAEVTRPVREKLQLSPDYFLPRLFEPTFTVQGPAGPETFPKNVIVLSIGPDVVRTLYRHRVHGYYVDPGGFWLNQDMRQVLADLSVATWFRKEFIPSGKVSVEAFSANFERIITLLREKTRAHILVMNVLTVEPGSRTHNYRFVQNAGEIRRRQFNLALVDLARRLDFCIVDVDRALKQAGLRDTQVDFAHYPDEVYPYIGREVFRILRDLEVFS